MNVSFWVFLVFGGAACFFGWRHVTSQGWHGFAIPLCALIALTGLYLGYRKWSLESKLNAVVAELSGVPNGSVACRNAMQEMIFSTNAGWVNVDEHGNMSNQTVLTRDICNDLRGYLDSAKVSPSAGQVLAVHVLTHESMHIAGERNEARTECQAIQRNAKTAELLGAAPDAAQALAREYWESFYPRMRDRYRTSECRAGGSLDETPDDGIWP